jgi:hypothetical protein
MSSKRVKMTVEMDVTVAQGLALQAMFKHWNRLASWGSSRMVAFYVDGDGNFKPKCNVTFSEEMPELTEDLEKAALIAGDAKGNTTADFAFDFDPVAWKLRGTEELVKNFISEDQELLEQANAARAEGFASDEDVAKLIVSDKAMDQLEKAVEDAPPANDRLKSAMSKFRVCCDELSDKQVVTLVKPLDHLDITINAADFQGDEQPSSLTQYTKKWLVRARDEDALTEDYVWAQTNPPQESDPDKVFSRILKEDHPKGKA